MNPRLKWLCRRGMKELDILVEGYLADDYPHASDADRRAFEKLLEYQDPLILDLLFARSEDPDPAVQSLVERLRVRQENLGA
ncbi:MAG: succinate dehydrogenase assembly factor 2 [Cardiobacteriaceae bacterium]|nr:succinate dehydrogenase assembly factor 2 [Cardiobacteriaceae bacterium]